MTISITNPANIRDAVVGCVCCGAPTRAIIGFGQRIDEDGKRWAWERVTGWRAVGRSPMEPYLDRPCPECGAARSQLSKAIREITQAFSCEHV